MANLSRVILPLALASCSCLALSPEEAEAFPASKSLQSIVYSNAFNGPDALPKNLTSGYAFAPAAGRNGTGALVYERKDAKLYNMQLFPLPKLDQTLTYQADVYVRAQDIVKHGEDKNIGAICVEYYRGKKWHSGAYLNVQKLNQDWQKLSLMISVPAQTDAVLNLYLRKGFTGKLWFDDLVLRSTGKDMSMVLNHPKMLSLNTADPTCVFTITPKLDATTVALLTASNDGKQQRLFLTPKDGRYQGTLKNIVPGPVTLTACLADTATREKISVQTYKLTARTPQTTPQNACTLADDGRAFVNGKPFLPIGVYGNASHEDLSELAKQGFNCLISYGSLGLCGETRTKNRIQDIKAGLDRFQKYGIKCIFSLKDQYDHKKWATRTLDEARNPTDVAAKVVAAIKDHPALLCWYINDEEPRSEVTKVQNLRQIISAIDPWHPTWTLTYKNNDFPYYGVSGDIMGTDKYMLDKRPTQDLSQVTDGMIKAMSSGQATWIVPQSFNWRVYRSKDPKVVADGHFPSAKEILAHTMIGVIHGAKGFVYYSHFDVRHRTEKLLPGSYRHQWPKTVASAQMLRKLEPYIMSGRKIRHLTVKQTGKEGIVEAAALTNDQGRQAIVIIAEHTHAAGTVTMPDGTTLNYAPGEVDALVIFK